MKIFLDSADLPKMVVAHKTKSVSGFTTNPTLMRKAGVKDYAAFAQLAVREIPDMSISFEVISNDLKEMEREARFIASWGKNVFVKIPIVNEDNDSCLPLIKKLNKDGTNLNITAVYTERQVMMISEYVRFEVPTIISIFAGRIADTGTNPIPIVMDAVTHLHNKPNIKLLWASCREVLNIYQAERCGCDIITVPHEILEKATLLGTDYKNLSLKTVQQFSRDARQSGYTL